jgi:hypothetical protein
MQAVRTFVYGAALLLALPPADAAAQPSCGTISMSNDIRQFGSLRAVELAARTSRPLTACPLELQTEAWVNGIGGADHTRGVHSAEVRVIKPVPSYGRWQSTAKHWLIWYGFMWEPMGTTFDATIVEGPPEPDPAAECVAQGGQWDYERGECDFLNSPVIVDVDGDGYRLTSVDDGVRFDLDADGLAEQVAWTEEGSDDAWLALDRNGNGRIDNGSELFGDKTPAYADQIEPSATNGFVALGFAEGPSYGGGMADRRIDSRDAVFARLLFWKDENHNGLSEPNELTPVSSTRLMAIATEYREGRRRDQHGNEFRLRAQSWWKTASGRGAALRPVYDVWLQSRP